MMWDLITSCQARGRALEWQMLTDEPSIGFLISLLIVKRGKNHTLHVLIRLCSPWLDPKHIWKDNCAMHVITRACSCARWMALLGRDDCPLITLSAWVDDAKIIALSFEVIQILNKKKCNKWWFKLIQMVVKSPNQSTGSPPKKALAFVLHLYGCDFITIKKQMPFQFRTKFGPYSLWLRGHVVCISNYQRNACREGNDCMPAAEHVPLHSLHQPTSQILSLWLEMDRFSFWFTWFYGTCE